MQDITARTITMSVDQFLGREPRDDGYAYTGERAREYSWDFAYNYFQDHQHPTKEMERSCMQLGYYLASWGMLRGSSYLFNHTNARHYMRALQVVEDLNPDMIGVDANRWSDTSTQALLVEAYQRLRESLLPPGKSALILVTKVMLGVWGNVPAFDSYFTASMRDLSDGPSERAAWNGFNTRSLALLGQFYDGHAAEIDDLARGCRTRDFISDGWTDRTTPRGKIVDMFGFQYVTWARATTALSVEPPALRTAG